MLYSAGSLLNEAHLLRHAAALQWPLALAESGSGFPELLAALA